MAKYYVFAVNSCDYSMSFTHDDYDDAFETLKRIVDEMPAILFPIKGCILDDNMEVVESIMIKDKKDGMD